MTESFKTPARQAWEENMDSLKPPPSWPDDAMLHAIERAFDITWPVIHAHETDDDKARITDASPTLESPAPLRRGFSFMRNDTASSLEIAGQSLTGMRTSDRRRLPDQRDGGAMDANSKALRRVRIWSRDCPTQGEQK